MELDISHRSMRFLGLEMLCSWSYEGLKVHLSQNTILNIIRVRGGSPERIINFPGRMVDVGLGMLAGSALQVVRAGQCPVQDVW